MPCPKPTALLCNNARKYPYWILPKALDKRLVTITWVKELYADTVDQHRETVPERKCVLTDFFSLSDKHRSKQADDMFEYNYHRKIVDEQVEKAKAKWKADGKPTPDRILIGDTYVGYDGGKEWGIFFEYDRAENDAEVFQRIQREIKEDIGLIRKEQDRLMGRC